MGTRPKKPKEERSTAAMGLIRRARLAADRLERLPADSSWAHRASGCRGSLLKLLDELDPTLSNEPKKPSSQDLEVLQRAVDRGYEILAEAAKERIRRKPGGAPSPLQQL